MCATLIHHPKLHTTAHYLTCVELAQVGTGYPVKRKCFLTPTGKQNCTCYPKCHYHRDPHSLKWPSWLRRYGSHYEKRDDEPYSAGGTISLSGILKNRQVFGLLWWMWYWRMTKYCSLCRHQAQLLPICQWAYN